MSKYSKVPLAAIAKKWLLFEGRKGLGAGTMLQKDGIILLVSAVSPTGSLKTSDCECGASVSISRDALQAALDAARPLLRQAHDKLIGNLLAAQEKKVIRANRRNR